MCISSSVATIWPFPITSLDYNCMRVSKLNDGGLFGPSHPHVPTQSQGHYKISKKRSTNLCSLKKQTLQTFLIKKAHNTDFCSLKKQTLQIFLFKKAHSTNFVSKKAHTTHFCSLKKRTPQLYNQKSGHYTFL
jgi:hypothetical protein